MTVLIDWNGETEIPMVGAGTATILTQSDFPKTYAEFDVNTGSNTYANWDIAASTKLAMRWYMKIPSTWPSSQRNLVSAGSNGPRYVMAGSGQPGQQRLISSTAALMASSSAGVTALSTWYRMEMQFDASTSQARMGVWSLSGTELWSTPWITATFGATVGRFAIGAFYSPLVIQPFGIAHIKVQDEVSDWIGPVAPESSEPYVTIWDGTNEISATAVQIWDGNTLKSARFSEN